LARTDRNPVMMAFVLAVIRWSGSPDPLADRGEHAP
jgi:hypothetical protein